MRLAIIDTNTLPIKITDLSQVTISRLGEDDFNYKEEPTLDSGVLRYEPDRDGVYLTHWSTTLGSYFLKLPLTESDVDPSDLRALVGALSSEESGRNIHWYIDTWNNSFFNNQGAS